MSAFDPKWTCCGVFAAELANCLELCHCSCSIQASYAESVSVTVSSLWQCGGAGVKLVRGFASLLAYFVGVSAIISIGIAGLMALQSPIERTPSAPTVVESHTERPAKPIKQTIVAQKKARPDQKHKMVHVTPKRTHEAPTIAAGDAYGYAQEPRRLNSNLFPIFGR